MANVRNNIRRKNNFQVVKQQEGYQKKLQKYISKKNILFFASVLLVGIVIIGNFLYWKMKVFNGYKVRSISEFKDAETMNCIPFGNYIVRYSMDGITCLDKSGSMVWGDSYEVKRPISSNCKDYIAIAAQRENKVYLYNRSGRQGVITTIYPIVDIDVAAQGVVAVMMESSGMNYVNLYDKDGTELSTIKTSLEGNGHPLAVGLSNDAQKLVISYLDIENNKLQNSLAFYNYSDVGQNYTEQLVGVFNQKELEGGLIPEVEFLTNEMIAAFSDKGIFLIRMKEKPVKVDTISVEEEIQSIFYDEEHIGLTVFDNTSESMYRVLIYNLSGNLILEKSLTEEYKSISFAQDQVIVHNDYGVRIFTLDGKDRFQYNFNQEIVMFKRISGYHYIMITSNSISEIELK